MKAITLWERWYKGNRTTKSVFKHNHIEDGHVIGTYPTPICDYQRRCWIKATWRFTHCYLHSGQILFRLSPDQFDSNSWLINPDR